MTSILDKLNLRPNERRLVVVVAFVVFVVLNSWIVWPHFGDRSKAKIALVESESQLQRYQAKIARIDAFESDIQVLREKGSAILPREELNQLNRTVRPQARDNGVNITSLRPISGTATGEADYFEKEAVAIDIETGDTELVNFLVALGTGESMIRVSQLNLRPNKQKTRLEGTMTLEATYQKEATQPE